MTEAWLIGLGKFFLHPLFYFTCIVSLMIGHFRVKRERENFNTRIFNRSLELRFVWQGLGYGLLLSIITIAVGVVIPFAAIVVLAALTIVVGVTMRMRALSPAYMVGITFFVIYFMAESGLEIPPFQENFAELDQTVYPSLGLLVGILLLAEGLLVRRQGHRNPTPRLNISKRGLVVGTYISKRVWLLPVFIFIPGGTVSLPFEWWPLFPVGEGYVTPLAVPFLIGFSQRVQGMLPKAAIIKNGKNILLLGAVITAIAAGGYLYPILTIIAVSTAMVGRAIMHYAEKSNDDKRPSYFSGSKLGAMILAVLPQSPAEKMGLEMGEVVTKMNGITVKDEQEFYEALQKNRAHCKLEVIGKNGQIRFIQRALYEGEHHELGILFVHDGKNVHQVG